MDAQQHVNVAPADMMATLVASVASAEERRFWGRTALQKTLFLAELELHRARAAMPGFRFYRFTFGPFSDDLALTHERLVELGWLEEDRPWPTAAALSILPPVIAELERDPASGVVWRAVGRHAREVATSFADKHTLCEAVYGMRLAPADWIDGYETTIREIPLMREIIAPLPLGREPVQGCLAPEVARGLAFLFSGTPEDFAETAEDSGADAGAVVAWLEHGAGDPWPASSG